MAGMLGADNFYKVRENGRGEKVMEKRGVVAVLLGDFILDHNFSIPHPAFILCSYFVELVSFMQLLMGQQTPMLCCFPVILRKMFININ